MQQFGFAIKVNIGAIKANIAATEDNIEAIDVNIAAIKVHIDVPQIAILMIFLITTLLYIVINDNSLVSINIGINMLSLLIMLSY